MIQLAFLLYVSCFFHSVELIGVIFTCPTFRDGVLNTVSCTINRTALTEAECFLDPESVMFDRTVGSTTNTLCFVTQIFNPSACNPASTSGENTCWCNGYDGDVFEYKFSFKPNQTKDIGAELECRICLFTAKHIDVTTSESCKNMTFAENLSFLDGTHVDAGLVYEVTAVCLAVILVTVSAVLAIYFIKRRRSHRRWMLRLEDCQRKEIHSVEAECPKQTELTNVTL